MITVGIVEKDPEFREAVVGFCTGRPEMQCVSAVESTERLLSSLPPGPVPEVLLMGFGPQWADAAAEIRAVRDRFPHTNVVVISDDGDFHRIFDLLCAGASGYLLRNTALAELCDAVREVAEGGAPMSPQIARKVIEFFHHRGVDPASTLTPREREIVTGLVDGLSYKQIAARMHITLETVRSHIKSIYQKLHVHGKAELIARSLRGEF